MDKRGLRHLRRITAGLIAVLLLVIGLTVARRIRGGLGGRIITVRPEHLVAGSAPGPGKTVSIYRGFEFTESVSGKTIFTLRADRTLGLSSGWQDIQGVRLELFQKGVHKATLTCDSARFNPQTRDARLVGAVHLQFVDGGFVDMDRGRLDSSSRSFLTDAGVVFSFGSLVGEAGRAVYRLGTDELLLENRVIVGRPGGQTLRAPLLRYSRETRRAVLPSGCVIRSGGAVVRARRGEIELAKEEGRVETVRLLGGVTMSGSVEGGPFEGWAETVTAVRTTSDSWQVAATTTGPWIRFVSWSGSGPGLRSLQTWRVRASFGPAGPVNAVCDPVVCLTEITDRGVQRRGEARTATVRFEAGAPTDLDLEGDVRLWGESVRASGAAARFLRSGDRLVLTSNPAGTERATLVSKEARVTADRVELENTGGARAGGNVQGRLEEGGPLFGAARGRSGPPVLFAAGALDISREGEILHLKKNARLWQGGRLLLADEMTYRRTAGVLEAAGSVRSTFPAGEAGATQAATGEVLIVARSLKADRESGVAVYRGNVQYSDSARILSASTLRLKLGADRSIETADADGQVVITDLVDNRRMTGDKAHFDVRRRLMELTGHEVHVTDAKGNVVTGTSLTWNGADGTVTISGGKNTRSETILQQEGTH